MAPQIHYRDPSDRQFKELEPGSPGPVGATGPKGPAGPDGAASPPVGSIIMYGGSVAPAGWHLCDGTAHGSSALQTLLGSANTPDLRDKFVLAAGATHAAKATGGAATVTLTAAQSGRVGHTHTGTRVHTHTADPPNTNTGAMSANASHSHGVGSSGNAFALLPTDGNPVGDGGHTNFYYVYAYAPTTSTTSTQHTHATNIAAFNTVSTTPTVTISTVTAANATAAHENLPPFWALTYLIRTV